MEGITWNKLIEPKEFLQQERLLSKFF
uniref:Uncharacterized protein n=1 Tax=Arundo donax TaxID=35708 RepID=A0A0A9CHL8_ARUDO